MYFCGPFHMNEQRQDNQLELTYSRTVPIQNVAQKTCWKQWMIEKGGKRGSEISVLMMVQCDDDDYDTSTIIGYLMPNPLYTYIYDLVWFYGTSTIVGYLMTNPLNMKIYIYIYILFGLVGFYGISTILSYFMLNPVFTYTLNMICKHIL